MLIHQRVNPFKITLNHQIPMVFLLFSYDTRLGGGLPITPPQRLLKAHAVAFCRGFHGIVETELRLLHQLTEDLELRSYAPGFNQGYTLW